MTCEPRGSLARAGSLAWIAAVVLAGCGGSPLTPNSPKDVINLPAGYSYKVPAEWQLVTDELRSPTGSIFSVQVLPLEKADEAFVAGLPDTVVPQLEQLTRLYFSVVEAPTRATATVGGAQATVLSYPVRIRAADRPGRVTFWLVRKPNRLYILRASFGPNDVASDLPAVESVLASWKFLAVMR